MQYRVLKNDAFGEGWEKGTIISLDNQAAKVRLETGDIEECYAPIDYKKDNRISMGVSLSLSNLIEVREVLNKMKIPFVLDGGTLLGAYRDKTFCKDDHDDVDLTTLVSSDKAIDILEGLSAKGFEIYHYWEKGKKNTSQLTVKRYEMKIDIMFKEVKGKNAWWTIFKEKQLTYKKVLSKFYTETKTILFKGVEFKIPKDVEEYLTLRYGDWNEPVHRSEYSCYTSDRVIVKDYGEI